MKVFDSGFVNIPVPEGREDMQGVIHALEDGISYFNYAMLGSEGGTCDYEQDLDIGMEFIAEAVERYQRLKS